MKNCLIINSSNPQEVIISLRSADNEYVVKEKSKLKHSHNLLILISKVIRKRQISINELSSIEIQTNGGSFTGIRIVITVANTLAWALNIPVNNEKFIVPRYSSSKFD